MPPQNLQDGGCRFGNDPKTSVLNKNCKAHELDNLYISDGSFIYFYKNILYHFFI